MNRTPITPARDLATFDGDIARIAATFAEEPDIREELRQEMYCRLLELPAGRSRGFYLRAVGLHAFNYWARSVLDAPLDRDGWPILTRRTRPVGGLAELDRIHRRRAA